MESKENNNHGSPDSKEQKSTKPMDSKKDVENANDEKIGQDFPGYPHYPAREDIMDQRTDSHRVDVDVEKMSNNNITGVSQRFGNDNDLAKKAMTPQPGLGDDDLDIHPGTEADEDEDDLAILNATNAEIGVPQNIEVDDLNDDLDIPGTELDDESEAIGEEDEENNYYSLGGDRHEGGEENPDSLPNRE